MGFNECGFSRYDKDNADIDDGVDDYQENIEVDDFQVDNNGIESSVLHRHPPPCAGGNLADGPPSNNNIGSNSLGTSNFVGSNSSNSYWGGKVTIGQIYSDKKELQKYIAMYAMSKNFQFRVIKSTKTLFMIQCAAKGCEWRMRYIRVKDSELFKVTRLNDNHKCSLDFINRSHMQASGKVIGECIKSKYNGVGRIYRPKDIIQDVRQEFGVNISYDKAWRAREAALESVRGTPEDSFSYLPHYCAELEKNNPGTITYIESDHEKRFKYFFMALGASLRGFRSAMQPVIVVDGTHLKGKYMGTLFVVAAQDGNKKIYPVAFGVGDSENNASWEWFFEKLRVALALEDFSELSLISDRHKSIERGVSLVFPESYHGHCMHHI
ncbi:protein FAR1-RELATED SEQUENCE 6-like [Tripterygium wilfordii]|uniref:protein FAR1-RELATED SEQUENCE 6-like n=1 Tax=Tripterygium wilfordii TaxID=458696 RepID=UPI0018F81D94|nr:protein FAR1-RELATED SEQUENCE 6-like [Tripterygium wilfordii]